MSPEKLVAALDHSNEFQLALLIHRARRADIDGAILAWLNISDGLRQCRREGAMDQHEVFERVVGVGIAIVRALGLIMFGSLFAAYSKAIAARDGFDMFGHMPDALRKRMPSS